MAERSVLRSLAPRVMMNVNHWDSLRGGVVVDAVLGGPVGRLEFGVELERLRRRVEPAGTRFLLRLEGVEDCEWEHEGRVAREPAEIGRAGLEICDSFAMNSGIEVRCDRGSLRLRYRTAAILLDHDAAFDWADLYRLVNTCEA